jgi:hypothetical protein
MKYLRVFENANQTIWILNMDDVFEDEGYFSSFTKVFPNEESVINYIINYCNDIQEKILNSNNYTDNAKEKYGKILLYNYQNCEYFLFELSDEFDHSDELETFIHYYESEMKDVQIRDDIKIKLDARKYNL